MPKETNDSFILELPLRASPADSKELDIRLNAARQLYNAALGESLRRLDLVKESRLWAKGRSLLKTGKKKEAKESFLQAQKKQEFSEYSLHAYIGKIRNGCWIGSHIDSSSSQKIATKAFQSAKEFLFRKKGRPRFKAYGRYRSIEGKSNASGIRFHQGKVVWSVRGGKKLELLPLYDKKDKHGVQTHAFLCRTKYVRLVRKTVRGNAYWYAQLVQEGKALQKDKNQLGNEIVGLDIGPSTIAIVSETTAALSAFCAGLEKEKGNVSKLQKRMDRSRRKTNPTNYENDGTIKAGPKKWIRSTRYKVLANKTSERQRCLAETRKRMHGELANKVLAKGVLIRTEKLSYKKLQQDFGRSVGFRAPGMFVSLLRRKAESAGGSVEEFSTYKTKLSQTCQCGSQKKKSLSDRWHSCACGVKAQRDLYSAHLARYVEKDKLDTCQAANAWTAAEPLLERAVSMLMQQANRKACLSSFGLGQRQSLSRAKGGPLSVEAVDVVGNSREPQRDRQLASRTPVL
jgi:putative transposase